MHYSYPFLSEISASKLYLHFTKMKFLYFLYKITDLIFNLNISMQLVAVNVSTTPENIADTVL